MNLRRSFGRADRAGRVRQDLAYPAPNTAGFDTTDNGKRPRSECGALPVKNRERLPSSKDAFAFSWCEAKIVQYTLTTLPALPSMKSRACAKGYGSDPVGWSWQGSRENRLLQSAPCSRTEAGPVFAGTRAFFSVSTRGGAKAVPAIRITTPFLMKFGSRMASHCARRSAGEALDRRLRARPQRSE